MRYIPILFKPEMVASILSGAKTQTRRVIKPQPLFKTSRNYIVPNNSPKNWHDTDDFTTCCRYGQIGDILWVKEPHYKFGKWVKNGITKTGRQKRKFKAVKSAGVKFTDKPPTHLESAKFRGLGWHKRSSLFMERADARIFLEITDVRVEKLQDISEADAIAEGVQKYRGKNNEWIDYEAPNEFFCISAKDSFKTLWKSINGAESWKSNPWVWVVSFVIKK